MLLAYPLMGAAGAILDTPPAARNIYEMQYQMAVFLHRYYPEGPVAVNDIGAVSYFNDFPMLDLYGLASMDVARAKIGGTYNTQRSSASPGKGARVVVVYDDWFVRYGGLPRTGSRQGNGTSPTATSAAGIRSPSMHRPPRRPMRCGRSWTRSARRFRRG